MPKISAFPFYQQHDAMDCGASCLRMIARWYGRFYSLEFLRNLTFQGKEGVSLLDISDAAEKIGMNTMAAKVTYDRILEGLPMPFIAHWRQQHFVVVYQIKNRKVWLADPALGKLRLTEKEFLSGWASDTQQGKDAGIILLLETTPDFYKREGEEQVDKSHLSFLWRYIAKYPSLLWQLLLGLLVGSLVQLVMPFLAQSIVDVGINNHDFSFIKIIIVAQIVLFLSYSSVELIRGSILLHIGTRVNISLVSDFLIKLTRLPLRFFDSKLTADILQRINDNQRVERLLTSAGLTTLFSLFNFLAFGVVLAFYHVPIFLVYLLFTVVYIGYIFLFLDKRKQLDARRFEQLSENQSQLIQMIGGIQDIKIHNAEKQKRWQWERLQAKIFRLQMDYLTHEQRQRIGANLINQSKNLFITFLAAKAVTEGSMSIGMMVAVQYIIGQLNAPLEQLVSFIHAAQDAQISLERLNDIHQLKEEELITEQRLATMPEKGGLQLQNVSFQYGSNHSTWVLRNLNLTIPKGKFVAIVGASGSGKTTLLKLLLGLYEPTEGTIQVGGTNLKNIQSKIWREHIGVVMQEGFIFSDSVANNIALGDDIADKKRLLNAVKMANIQGFIDTLPNDYNTKIGAEGVGLSQGQKQRLLIARALYKNPDYLFLDEATNALDAYNELVIMDNLNENFAQNQQKTIIVVAHRLSTVRHADLIIVLDKGEIIETGTHTELTYQRGAYFHLVKNQLELGQ